MNKFSSIEMMSKMWNETKEKMRNDNYEFIDIDSAIKRYPILDRIHQAFSYPSEWRYYELKKNIPLTRIVCETTCSLSRIIPDSKFKALNRMTPKDRFYGYYVAGYNNNSLSERIHTGILEKRAQNDSYICTADFYPSRNLKLAKLIPDYAANLQFNEESFLLDMQKIKRYHNIHGGTAGKREIAQCYTYNLLTTVMNDSDVFAPVDGSDENRYYYYAPFHVLASYFESNDYDGIIYPSSVSENGICVAIFQPDLIIPKADTLQCKLDVKDYL